MHGAVASAFRCNPGSLVILITRRGAIGPRLCHFNQPEETACRNSTQVITSQLAIAGHVPDKDLDADSQ